MSTFVRSLIAEYYKAHNSLAMWLALLGTTGIILTFLAVLFFGTANFLPEAGVHPWHNFMLLYYEATAFMLLPLFAIIIAALLCYVEHRYGMWKHLLTTTISRVAIYLSKLLFAYLFIAAAHLYFIVLMLISAAVLAVFRPELKLLEQEPDFVLLITLAVKTLLSIAGMLALQFWISMRFRSFIVALGVGVIGFVICSLLLEWPYIVYLPYAYPMLYLEGVAEASLLGRTEIMSLVYLLVFSILGVLDFRRMQPQV